MQILCPGCAKTLNLPPTAAGTTVQCPLCGTLVPLGAAYPQSPGPVAPGGYVPQPGSAHPGYAQPGYVPQPGYMPAAPMAGYPAAPGYAPPGGVPHAGAQGVALPGYAASVATLPTGPAQGTLGGSPSSSSTSYRRNRKQAKHNTTAMVLLSLGALIVVGGLIALGVALVGDRNARLANDPATQVRLKTQQLLTARLKLPANAEFPTTGDLIQPTSDGQWVVTSYVDLPSPSLGIAVRQRFTARLKADAQNQWQLASLEVDGRNVGTVEDDEPAPRSPFGSRLGLNRNDNPPASSNPPPASQEHNTRYAMEHIADEVAESLKLRNTVVVWLVDRSASAQQQQQEALRQIETFFKLLTPSGGGKQLSMALGTFGAEVQFPVDQPSTDRDALRKAFDALEPDNSGKEMLFTAVLQAAEKYHGFRTSQGAYVYLVILSDESGDDQDQLEPALALVRQHSLIVHAVGVSAPFGRTVAAAQKTLEQGTGQSSLVQQGPESCMAEVVDLAFSSSYGSSDLEQLDSGFGPFSVSRLCLESGGTYFTCVDYGVAASSGFRMTGWGWGARPAAQKATVDSTQMRKYAPDYVSPEQYRQIVAANKACQVLHEAAKLPRIEVFASSKFDFPKSDEAQFKRSLDMAQRDAARFEPQIIALADLLKQGESDRAKLTSPRWQAGYDLALGRALAARVRCEGYNAMLAKLKGNSAFANQGSNTWVLEPSDTIGAGSTFEKMLDQSKMYLERVVKDHPGTPWATLAAKELESKIGWQWSER